ncbi:MAG TPA: RDD family protein [Terracidiphilus sp.]|nr:RDD family protein [Terracidiphilus sp.]
MEPVPVQRSDQLSIDTPELVSIEMPLAGLGSRFIALLIDTLIWLAGFFVLSLLFWAISPAIYKYSQLSYKWTVALATLLTFLLNWGYFTLFEAFWNGRTPGKRVAHIRVIQRTGRAIGLFESMARNFVRYIDQIPFCYAVGVIAMFATKQHQRLGDLAAGTLVVRERVEESPLWGDSGTRTFTAPAVAQSALIPEPHHAVTLPASGVAKLSATDLEVLEGFFARRLDLPEETRRQLGARIAGAIRAKSGLEPPADASTETFLEAVARDLRDVARMG